MEKKILVDGMKCEHCKKNVINALKEIKDVEEVDVNLDSKEVTIVSSKEIDISKIREKVEEKGFKVI